MIYKIDGTAPVVPDSATLALYTRVKVLSTGTFSGLVPIPVTTAGIEDDIGVLINVDPFQNTTVIQPLTALLANNAGTVPMIASGAITAGVTVYPDASGKITATVQGNPIGIALQSASGNNSVIEVMRFRATRKLFTQTYTLLAASVSSILWICDRAAKLVAAKINNDVVSASGTLALRKLTSAGTARAADAAGATVKENLTGTLDLTTVAGTTAAATIQTSTPADNLYAVGDKMGMKFGGTLTSLVGNLTVTFEEL